MKMFLLTPVTLLLRFLQWEIKQRTEQVEKKAIPGSRCLFIALRAHGEKKISSRRGMISPKNFCCVETKNSFFTYQKEL
jgi:hypothetical protein